jgi:hypothetical protein
VRNSGRQVFSSMVRSKWMHAFFYWLLFAFKTVFEMWAIAFKGYCCCCVVGFSFFAPCLFILASSFGDQIWG